MDLHELRCFQHVANLGSLSKASVQLGLTQPSLTRQIQKLEQEFGTKLFYRNGRGVTLTHAGQRLLDGASELLSDAVRLRQDMIEQASSTLGEIAVGMPPSLCASIGGDLAYAFRQSYPDASLRLYELFSANLLEWVCAGRLDLAVLYDVRRTPGLLVTPLLREHLFLVSAADAQLPVSAPTLEALGELDVIMPSAANGLRKVVQSAMAGVALFRPMLEIDSIAVIKQLVARGVGVTVLPYGAIHREVSEGKLRAQLLDPDILSATLVTATPALQPVTNITRLLSDQLVRQVELCLAGGVLRGVPLVTLPGRRLAVATSPHASTTEVAQ